MVNLNITYGLHEIEEVAHTLIKAVSSKVILLHGNMGAGKTTLVKSIAKVLGSEDAVSSPTFSIVNEYKISEGLLFHFDLYRITDLEEAYSFGIEDYIYSDNWIIIEWPDIIKPILSNNYSEVEIEEKTKNLRIITVQN